VEVPLLQTSATTADLDGHRMMLQILKLARKSVEMAEELVRKYAMMGTLLVEMDVGQTVETSKIFTFENSVIGMSQTFAKHAFPTTSQMLIKINVSHPKLFQQLIL
jgi:hypothetical protein